MEGYSEPADIGSTCKWVQSIIERSRFRSIWIFDIHLVIHDCKTERLLHYIGRTESDYLYLVRDFFDGWRLRQSWYWPQSHNDVVQKILRKARKGTKIIYVPGNHDEVLRSYTGRHFGSVVVVTNTVHETAYG